MAYLGREYVGLIFAFFITLSVSLGILALFMIARRLVFARVIELTDDGILYPRGFPKTHITSIACADVVRIRDYGQGTRAGLTLVTGRGTFTISASYFTHIENYNVVKDFVCAKTSIVIPREDRRDPLKLGDWKIWGFPEPLLRWNEPEQWPRYRTCLARSKPLLPRLVKALGFFARCFGIFFVPWLLLWVLGVPTADPVPFLVLTILAALFITWIYHWLATVRPVHCTEISFRDNGITQFFGKQTADWNYHQFSGWAIVERQFEGQAILILLLKGRSRMVSFAIPDVAIGDQLARLLHDKSISHTKELKPPWEDPLGDN